MSGDALLAMLAGTPIGRELSAEDLPKVAAISSVLATVPGTVLFQEGDHSERLYVVIEGLVGLEMCLPRQGCVRILTVGPGEFVGWSAIVGSGHMTTRATVIEPTTLVVLPGNRLRRLCDADHDIGYAVMRQIASAVSQRLLATRLQMLDVFGETQSVRPPVYSGTLAHAAALGT